MEISVKFVAKIHQFVLLYIDRNSQVTCIYEILVYVFAIMSYWSNGYLTAHSDKITMVYVIISTWNLPWLSVYFLCWFMLHKYSKSISGATNADNGVLPFSTLFACMRIGYFIQISFNFVPKVPIEILNKAALIQIKAWCQRDKQLSETRMAGALLRISGEQLHVSVFMVT